MIQQATEKEKKNENHKHFNFIKHNRYELQSFITRIKKIRSQLTTQDLFAYLESIQYGCCDASHGADHASQTQVDQHEEEHDRPEGTAREMCHGLCEGDECQTSALNRLEEREKEMEVKGGQRWLMMMCWIKLSDPLWKITHLGS